MARTPTPSQIEVNAEDPLEAPPPAEGDRLRFEGRGLREDAARGVVINAAFHAAFATLGLVQRFAVAGFLSVTEFGIWGIVLTVVLALTWLRQIGIGDKYVQQDEQDQELAFQRAFTLEFVYTAIWTLLALIALPIFALAYGTTEIIAPGAVLCLAVLAGSLQTPVWIAYREMRFVRQRLIEAINPVLSTIVMVALAASGAGYWSLVLGVLAGSVAAGAVALGTCPYKLAWRLDRLSLRSYVDFSGPLLVAGVAGLVVAQGTMIVGNASFGLAGLGALALAASLITFAERVDGIISMTIYPAVCAVKDQPRLLLEVFVKSNRMALMCGMPFGFGLFLFAPDLIHFVLGDRWEPAVGLLQALGLVVAIRQVAFNWVVFVNATGNTRAIAWNGAVLIVVFFVVTAPALIILGLAGFIVGSAATLVAELCIRAYFMHRLLPGFRLMAQLVRAITPVIPAVLCVLAVRLADSGSRGIGQALGELTLFLVVAGVATVLLERRLLSEVLGYLRREGAAPALA